MKSSDTPVGNSIQPLDKAVVLQSATFTDKVYSRQELQEILSLSLNILGNLSRET